MDSSRREFLFNSAAVLALGVISRPVSAAETPDARLEKLFDRLFEGVLEISPQLAVTLRRDSGRLSQSRMRLDDETPDGQARRAAVPAAILAGLRKFDPSGLSLRGQLDYEAMLFSTQAEAIAREHFTFGRVDRRISPYVVSHMAGSYLDAPEFISTQRPAPDGNGLEVYVSRLRDFGRNLDGESERIRRAASVGVVPPDFILERTLGRMRAQQDKLATRSILHSVPDPDNAAQGILDNEVRPKLAQQISLLESLRAKASVDAGLSRLKNCEDCYSAALRVGATTEPRVPEFQRQGNAEVHELNARADRLLRKVGLKRGSVSQRLRSLAADERYLYPDSDAGKERAVADMNARLRAIFPAVQPLFKTPINTNIEVRRLTAAEELAGRVGYRVAPSADGVQPGVYFVDLHAIRDRPTWSLPSATYHETLPGHLLQLPLQQAAKPQALCEVDVDRYFVQPGMIGGDEIGYYGWREARAKARRQAGHKYDPASFHDQGLKFGPLPQTLLDRIVSG